MTKKLDNVKGQVKRKYNGGGFDERPQDINREGGPEKQWQWKEILLKEVERDSIKREGYKRKESMAIAQIEKAEEGDTSAFNSIADRMEGKPVQDSNVNHSGSLDLLGLLSKTDGQER